MKKNFTITLILMILTLSACKQQDISEDLRAYHFNSSEDVEAISDDDLIYIVQHNYISSDFMPEAQLCNVDLFGVPLAEYNNKGVTQKEDILMVPYRINANEKIDLERPLSSDAILSYADSYCKHLIESANTFNGNTGSRTKEEEIIYCGENDFYIEYSIRYTELRTMHQNFFRKTYKIPRAYRRCFLKNMVSFTDDSRTYKAYLGMVTPEAIQDEMDSFLAGNSNPILYRDIRETDDAVIYTYYEPYTVGGDYGMCDTANLVKTENTYNKLTHEETQNTTYVKEIEIPDTYHDEP